MKFTIFEIKHRVHDETSFIEDCHFGATIASLTNSHKGNSVVRITMFFLRKLPVKTIPALILIGTDLKRSFAVPFALGK